MTKEQAEKTANVLLGIAAVGAAYYVLRTPALRRVAWQVARAALVSGGPAWLMSELRRGWSESPRAAAPGQGHRHQRI
jgi:hypothetical protein